MIASALFLAGFITDPAPATAADRLTGDRAAFARQVARYRSAVEPLCAPRTVAAYVRFNRDRDSAFRASLRGTDLNAIYLATIREWREREARTVRECQGPPPPPPPPGAPPQRSVDPRGAAIAAAQGEVRAEADAIPGHFDEGDADFARLVELRDRILHDGKQ